MKKLPLLPVLFLLSALPFFSCNKERSCVSCINVNRPPVAKAGADQVISLPTATVIINGNGSVDPDNDVISYHWTKISGPSSFDISNQNGVQTQVASLVPGVYEFELKVTDAGGLSARDTVKVSVILLNNEAIFNNLTWKFWHDQNDPNGLFDEIYLSIPDSANILANSPLNIYVKLDTGSAWVLANPVINGNCTPPYTYFTQPTAANTLILFIDACSLNNDLIGTGASVKINY